MVTNDSKDFGKELKKRRKELGYTQAYISEFTGFSVSFISDLENGKATAEIGKAIKYANLLGLDVKLDVRGQ
jgi:transcriptional regulator with XRE-family HTH domain